MNSSSNYEDLVVIMHPMEKKRRFWAHPLLQSRDREGEFHFLIKELKLYRGWFGTYFSMSKETFKTVIDNELVDHFVADVTVGDRYGICSTQA